MNNSSSQTSLNTRSLFKNALLALWLLSLPASGFAPLFYSSPEAQTAQSQTSADSKIDSPADSGVAPGVAPKSSVNFWLIASAAQVKSLSVSERSKRLRDKTEFSIIADGLPNWSRADQSGCNRNATLKLAEFTLLGLKPSGVS